MCENLALHRILRQPKPVELKQSHSGQIKIPTLFQMNDLSEDRSYRLSSWFFARALGVVLLIAFVSLGIQVMGLFGSTGIQPLAQWIASAHSAHHTFWDHPSVLWWATSDIAIQTVIWVGALASVTLIVGCVPKLALLIAWGAYLSFVTVGWPFLSFQWDSLLLEVSFASIFFVPWKLCDHLQTHAQPHPIARWVIWGILFRLVFRSAYVKLASGDPVWANLTALSYHYWTQPLPTSLGWYAAQLPSWFQKTSCVLMFIIEFGGPLLILVPHTRTRRLAAILITILMATISATGNYGFFNLLTIALCIPLLDDTYIKKLLPFLKRATTTNIRSPSHSHAQAIAPSVLFAMSLIVFWTGTFGAGTPRFMLPVSRLMLVNNYGLFAVMTTERPEIVIEGSINGEHWTPYEFKYKPGPLNRAPVWSQPNQPRLDWQFWFAALEDYWSNPWLGEFIKRLLNEDPTVLALLKHNPFEEQPPSQIRAIIYSYRFTTLDEREQTGNWWQRSEYPHLYMPIIKREQSLPNFP